jgi:hypothetical protein
MIVLLALSQSVASNRVIVIEPSIYCGFVICLCQGFALEIAISVTPSASDIKCTAVVIPIS